VHVLAQLKGHVDAEDDAAILLLREIQPAALFYHDTLAAFVAQLAADARQRKAVVVVLVASWKLTAAGIED